MFYKTTLLPIALWIITGIIIHNSLFSYHTGKGISIVTCIHSSKYETNMENNETEKKEFKRKSKKKTEKTEPSKNKAHEKYLKKLKKENDSILDKLHIESYIEENYNESSNQTNKLKKRKVQYKKVNNDKDLKKTHHIEEPTANLQNPKLMSMLEERENSEEDQEEEQIEKHCDEDGNECLEDLVVPFVNLMKNINQVDKTEEKKQHNAKNETNVYNDEQHTITVYDEDNDDTDLYEKYKTSQKNGMKTTVIEGSEYLGVGYDFIYGNPIGDPFLNVDPGYRDTIVKLTYPKSDTDYPDNFMNINPNGSFIRNEISCTRSEKDTEISSMSAYSKELSVDASVSVSAFLFASFSASTGYQSTSSTISKNKDKIFMLKSYCFKYVASLSQYSQWKLTDQFKRAISLLPSYFNSLEEEGKFCHPLDFKEKGNEDLCGPSVAAWMNFFKNFGTHVSTIIHLGGKITQTLKISKSEYKSMENQGLSVSVSASAKYAGIGASASTDTNSSSSKDNENKKSSMEKDTVIIGGVTIFDPNNPDDFEIWAKSIKKNAMPIKGEYEPLSRILPLRLVEVYEQALEFYVYLSTPANVQAISNDDASTLDLREYLKKADLVYTAGPGLQMVQCDVNKNFILGFSISIPEDLEDLDDFSAATCDADQDKCFSTMGSKQMYSYLIALCSEEYFPFLEQKMKAERGQFLSLECSQKDQVILFGFGFSVLNSNAPVEIVMHSCVYGKRTCSIQGITQKSQAALWIVCGHVDTLNSKFKTVIERITKVNIQKKKRQPINGCGSDALFNFLFEFSNISFSKRNGKCIKAVKGCWSSFADTCYNYQYDADFVYYMFTLY